MQSIKIHHTEKGTKWSSFSDIGISVSLEEYLRVEQVYVEFILNISKYMHIKEYQIVSLEDYAHCSKYKEADVICLQDLDKIIRDVLREKYWCKFISPNLQVHFGYDYCMYVVSFINSINLNDFQYDATAITIKNYISPYLNC